MMQKYLTCDRSRLLREFTFRSNRRAWPFAISIRVAGIVAALLLLISEPAAARTQMGSSSSTSIGISLSVAPRFGLRTSATPIGVKTTPTAQPDSYCMAANGPLTFLPVMLVRESAQSRPVRAGEERVEQLSPCKGIGGPLESADSGDDAWMSGLLIVRPE